MTLVKVQLPIDLQRAQIEGALYADKASPEVLVYDRAHRHVFQGRDDHLRDFMLAADNGTGYVKAFLIAEWRGDHWQIDYEAGFQPLTSW